MKPKSDAFRLIKLVAALSFPILYANYKTLITTNSLRSLETVTMHQGQRKSKPSFDQPVIQKSIFNNNVVVLMIKSLAS